ncbi:MAG: hypothetical protein ABWY22_02980 [Flavobacterium sp.]
MYQSFIDNNSMTEFEAKERALAYVLKDSGIDLLKVQPGSNDFRKIDVKSVKKSDGTEKKDANGFTIYESVDCI